MPDPAPIPFHRPLLGAEEVAAVAEVLQSGWLTTGPAVARFESEFRDYVRARHALAVNSATAALHLALAALDIGPGAEVITTPLTFCATVNAILHVCATPVLADIDDTLNLDPAHVEAALTPATRAILPVHFAGLPCDITRLGAIARRHRLAVVEDAAHAVGSFCAGAPVGAGASDAVAFSFYATKNMTTGEGGMVTTPSRELDERMRILCLHGMDHHAWNRYSDKGTWAYDVVECGFKYNMSDIAAALGRVQLQRLESMTHRRRAIAAAYTEAFAASPELQTPPQGVGHSWHLYVLRLNLDKLAIGRDEFIDQLKSRGIGCSVHFIPIPLLSYYSRALTLRDPCQRALSEYQRLVSLPLYARMTDSEVGRVIETVQDVVSRCRKRRMTAGRAATGAAASADACA